MNTKKARQMLLYTVVVDTERNVRGTVMGFQDRGFVVRWECDTFPSYVQYAAAGKIEVWQ